MTQMKVELDKYSQRVLDVVKGMHGLKNRNDAFNKFVHEFGDSYVKKSIMDEKLQKLDLAVADHKKKYESREMSEDELNEILGL